jgi:hypothetical protein
MSTNRVRGELVSNRAIVSHSLWIPFKAKGVHLLHEWPAAGLTLVAVLGLALASVSALADVRFENCVPLAGGGITCDTQPEGNTLTEAEAARFGLLDEASPGWNEFEPYEGVEDMFGGNQT